MSIFKFEIKCSLNIYFAAALIIGCAVTLSDIFNVLKFTGFMGKYPPSLYQYWIGVEFRSLQNTLYFMLTLILAALPFADSYFCDKRGYIKQIVTRVSRKRYLSAKYLAVFLSGGLAFSVPLIVNFIAVACICPALSPQASTGTFATYENGFLSLLFISHPLVYCAFYTVYDFLIAGLFATVSLTAALFIKNRFAVLASPFILFLLWSVITGGLNLGNFDAYNILRASQGFSPKPDAFSIIAVPLVLILATFPLYFVKSSSDDVM